MSTTPEVWDFPRFHGVKAIGFSRETVQTVLVSLIESLKLKYQKDSITSKESSNGKYTSVTIKVYFTNDQEVRALYGKLHSHTDIVQSL